MKEMTEYTESKPDFGKGEKKPTVLRRNSTGQEVQMEVGIQPALLDETDPKFLVKGKSIDPREQERTDSATFGYIRPEVAKKARRQRYAITRNYARRNSK